MKSILDPTFKYVPAAETDLRKTYARIRREQAKAEQVRKPAQVTPIRPKGIKAS